MHFRLIPVIALFAVFISICAAPARAEKTTTSIVFRKCYKAELSAIFGADLDACLVYNMTKNEGSIDFNIS
jgi:hypothetical protein